MGRLRRRLGLVSLCLIIALLFPFLSPVNAASVTQADYVVELASQLGLGEGLSPEEAVSALRSVGVEPEGGWQLGSTIDSEFIKEMQDVVQSAVNAGKITISEEMARAAASAAAGGRSGALTIAGISGGTITAAAVVATLIVVVATQSSSGSDNTPTSFH